MQPICQLSVARFAAVAPWIVRALCGPVESSDSCLISLKNPSELWNAVHASDGRVYDAPSLHRWIREYRSEVIPTQPITTVQFCPWPLWCAGRSSDAVRCGISRAVALIRENAIVRRGERSTKIRAPMKRRRAHMLLQVLENHATRRHAPFRNARRITQSDLSAFTIHEKRAR